MNHLNLAKELNTFSFEYNKTNHSDFSITEETQKRVIVSKLYYSLFHRILSELPVISNSTAVSQHQTVLTILIKQSSSGDFYLQLSSLFKDLKKFRIWADYTVSNNIPANMNLKILLLKVNKFISAKKVIV